MVDVLALLQRIPAPTAWYLRYHRKPLSLCSLHDNDFENEKQPRVLSTVGTELFFNINQLPRGDKTPGRRLGPLFLFHTRTHSCRVSMADLSACNLCGPDQQLQQTAATMMLPQHRWPNTCRRTWKTAKTIERPGALSKGGVYQTDNPNTPDSFFGRGRSHVRVVHSPPRQMVVEVAFIFFFVEASAGLSTTRPCII